MGIYVVLRDGVLVEQLQHGKLRLRRLKGSIWRTCREALTQELIRMEYPRVQMAGERTLVERKVLIEEVWRIARLSF
jgi:hypothetical protein